jgi:hypothetical protein
VVIFAPLPPDPSPDAAHATALAAELRAAGRQVVLVRASPLGIGSLHPDFGRAAAEDAARRQALNLAAGADVVLYRDALLWPDAPRHLAARARFCRDLARASATTRLVLPPGWRRHPVHLLLLLAVLIGLGPAARRLVLAGRDMAAHLLAGHARPRARGEAMAVTVDLDLLHDIVLHADLASVAWVAAARAGPPLPPAPPLPEPHGPPMPPERGTRGRRPEHLGPVLGALMACAGREEAGEVPPGLAAWTAGPIGDRGHCLSRIEYLAALVAHPGGAGPEPPWRSAAIRAWFRASVLPAAPGLAPLSPPLAEESDLSLAG